MRKPKRERKKEKGRSGIEGMDRKGYGRKDEKEKGEWR